MSPLMSLPRLLGGAEKAMVLDSTFQLLPILETSPSIDSCLEKLRCGLGILFATSPAVPYPPLHPAGQIKLDAELNLHFTEANRKPITLISTASFFNNI